jgi:hypothetical protein
MCAAGGVAAGGVATAAFIVGATIDLIGGAVTGGAAAAAGLFARPRRKRPAWSGKER